MTDQLPYQQSVVTPTQVVEKFFCAFQEKDFDTLGEVFDDNIDYHNVGLPVITGRHRVIKFLRRLDRPNSGFDIKIHRIASDASSVITERTDAMVFGRFRMQFWVWGVFEVHDGRITLWRDYFDYLDMLKAAIRGVVAMAVPALRPSL